eukprot:CAMPEP_0119140986 /NCGR_PEP_ID=MMETSP1310-20130426/30168_1 /TAXON_ID=464262 /ORGANISM="Genus nov. species nov., Strain RCC2339" /LENGTH=299 /DNA_ID=CAMNT_0007132393 /DNA_START=106 /DNA_END=1005 /DNA_ORIENTATION=+
MLGTWMVLILAIVVNIGNGDQSVVRTLNDGAMTAISEGRWEDARSLLEEAVQLEDSTFGLWHNLGLAYENLHKLEKALEAYDEGLAIWESEQGLHAKSNVLVRLGRLDEALETLEALTELYPTSVSGWTNLGSLLQREKRVVDAQTAYRKALELDQNSPEVQFNICAILVDGGEPQAALDCFDLVIRTFPDFKRAHVGRGVALEKLNRLNDAVDTLLEADEADPHALYNLGILFLKTEYFDEAIVRFERCIAVDPMDAQCKEWLARARQARTDFITGIKSVGRSYTPLEWKRGDPVVEL